MLFLPHCGLHVGWHTLLWFLITVDNTCLVLIIVRVWSFDLISLEHYQCSDDWIWCFNFPRHYCKILWGTQSTLLYILKRSVNGITFDLLTNLCLKFLLTRAAVWSPRRSPGWNSYLNIFCFFFLLCLSCYKYRKLSALSKTLKYCVLLSN